MNYSCDSHVGATWPPKEELESKVGDTVIWVQDAYNDEKITK